MNYRAIAKELLSEHPQTIAVALARLPAEHSSEILKLLPAFMNLLSRHKGKLAHRITGDQPLEIAQGPQGIRLVPVDAEDLIIVAEPDLVHDVRDIIIGRVETHKIRIGQIRFDILAVAEIGIGNAEFGQ